LKISQNLLEKPVNNATFKKALRSGRGACRLWSPVQKQFSFEKTGSFRSIFPQCLRVMLSPHEEKEQRFNTNLAPVPPEERGCPHFRQKMQAPWEFSVLLYVHFSPVANVKKSLYRQPQPREPSLRFSWFFFHFKKPLTLTLRHGLSLS
jgi:hypothetical protein